MRFNFLKRQTAPQQNYEGARAYVMTPELELYSAVATAGLSDKFYETTDSRILRIRQLIAKNDPDFVAKLAVYTRTKMNLRSVSLVLAVELSKTQNGNSLVSKTVSGVVRRADEITEMLAYYQMSNARTQTKKLNRLSKQVQKGLAQAFNNFDEYQFAKYNRAGEVKLRDALFLTHPKAKNEKQQAVFKRIAEEKLEIPYTWETELSALGQQKFESDKTRSVAFQMKWEELIDSGKVGYMALLRNLCNIIQSDVSFPHVDLVAKVLSDQKEVMNSKQLPFRFLSAYREVKALNRAKAGVILDALEDAVAISASNIKGFDSNVSVLIACDVSGSMQTPISPKSKVLNYDIGLMLAMLLRSKCKNAITGMFGDIWKTISVPSRSVLANVQEFYRREGEVGYSTNGYLVLEDLIQHKVVIDKVMMFTDCQMWDSQGGRSSMQSSWMRYKVIAPSAQLILFDLAGHGQSPVRIDHSSNVFLIAGWSDKVFEVLDAIDNDQSAIEMIKQMEI